MLSTTFGDLVALWWVVADSPGAKISNSCENCSADFFAHCNPCIPLDPKLDSKAPLTTNCRVKRHLMTTKNHEHGRPAEIKPEITMFTQGVKNARHPSRPQTSFKSTENLSLGQESSYLYGKVSGCVCRKIYH
jgi:hypothetical protein